MKSTFRSLWSIPILITSLTSAINLDCTDIRTDGKKWNFEKIGGPHSVTVIDEDRPPSVYNTTWTIDICQALKKKNDVDAGDQCKTGTYVCGIVRSYNPVDDPDKDGLKHVENVIPVAGNYHTSEGKGLEPHYERLKAKDSNVEGLEISLNGGTFNNKKQKAVIQFQCDPDRTGNEGAEGAASKLRRRDDDDKDKEGDGSDDANSLSYVSWGAVGGKEDTDVLRLNWRTKYACEDFEDDDDSGEKKASWGFFTWLILLVFLGTAAYLIFGSWLNYNRYGARGWDLLPHGDTIRDIPYLVKDWSRKVVDTVSGSGSRGGYSAV